MSKYKRGAYHYADFHAKTPYREHVIDLVTQTVTRMPKDRALPVVIEVGAGEGLILSRFSIFTDFMCKGCDIDPRAVDLARDGCNDVKLGSIEVFAGERADVVLLCDVLEHVKDPFDMIEKAKAIAPMLVIAVPDRHDPHGERDFAPNAFDQILSEWGTCVHRATRHARHLTIWQAN